MIEKLEIEANKFFVEQTLGNCFLMSDEETINFIEACEINIKKLRQLKENVDDKTSLACIEIFIKSICARLLNVNRAGRLRSVVSCD